MSSALVGTEILGSRLFGSGSAAPPILICILGQFRLFSRGRAIALRDGGKMEGLLSRLALRHEYGLSRDELLASLWPEAELSLANRCLHTLIYELRKLLGKEINGASPVLHGGGYYRLNLEAGVEVDAARFEALACAGARHACAGRTEAAADSFRQAVDLYHGQPIHTFEGWPAIEIERLGVLYLNLLSQLADYYFAKGDNGTCLGFVQRLLAKEPCREDAHRMAMRCYLRLGTRAQALRQYELCKRMLADEFDVGPEAETRQLFDFIKGATACLGQA